MMIMYTLKHKVDEDEEVVERFKHACHNLRINTSPYFYTWWIDNNRYVKKGIRGIVVA